jgi:hypothetical protein
LFPICGILAHDTVGHPGDGRETFRIDIPPAVDANPKSAIIQPVQRATQFTRKGAVAVKKTDLQLALLTVLDAVHLVGTYLNRKIRPVVALVFKFRLSDFQNLSECVKFSIRHRLILALSTLQGFFLPAITTAQLPEWSAGFIKSSCFNTS